MSYLVMLLVCFFLDHYFLFLSICIQPSWVISVEANGGGWKVCVYVCLCSNDKWLTAALGRGGGKSPSSGGSGSGSGTGTGLRRQQSLTERERPRRDRASVHEGKLWVYCCCLKGVLTDGVNIFHLDIFIVFSGLRLEVVLTIIGWAAWTGVKSYV